MIDSSSEDIAKMPSLGTLWCVLTVFLPTGLGVEETLKGNPEDEAVIGAVRGPSLTPKLKRLAARERVGVTGGVDSSVSSSVSVKSSQIGNEPPAGKRLPTRRRTLEALGSDRDKLAPTEMKLRGTGIALGKVFALAELEGDRFGCLRRASLPEGRVARVGMDAGRVNLERTLGSSKNGSKGFELLDLYVGEGGTSACEVGRGGDC